MNIITKEMVSLIIMKERVSLIITKERVSLTKNNKTIMSMHIIV
jgi:hypothetical protein